MKRRNFFRLLGVSAAAPLIAKADKAKEEIAAFQAPRDAGNEIFVSCGTADVAFVDFNSDHVLPWAKERSDG